MGARSRARAACVRAGRVGPTRHGRPVMHKQQPNKQRNIQTPVRSPVGVATARRRTHRRQNLQKSNVTTNILHCNDQCSRDSMIMSRFLLRVASRACFRFICFISANIGHVPLIHFSPWESGVGGALSTQSAQWTTGALLTACTGYSGPSVLRTPSNLVSLSCPTWSHNGQQSRVCVSRGA